MKSAPSTNLPNPVTSFVGRRKELGACRELLGNSRLLMLTGAGGSGKTRLAIQIAHEAVGDNRYKNGVWWCDLAPITDPALVVQGVATVFSLREFPDTPLLELVTNFLREKETLLILDNCEHLIDACARLGETLLRACPNLHILATSREALNVTGEVVWRVPSLAMPDAAHLPPLRQLLEYDAIQLFTLRAAAIAPNWKLAAAGNERAVVEICTSLDGIPLAIELAAARLKALSAEQIAARLDDRFSLLTGGSRTALHRQQTLRATIDWSYDLLSETESAMLRRLSVFSGGWTLEAAEAVCFGDGIAIQDVIDLLTRLLDKSMCTVQDRDGLPRYRMLETIRQYARDKSVERGEAEVVRDRHLDYFLRFAERAESRLGGPEQFEWLDRLDLEHDNLRSALDGSLGRGQVERGLRLTAALRRFWDMRGHWNEALDRTQSLLNQPEAASRTLTRANALLVAADSANSLGGFQESRHYLEESIAIAREHGAAGQRTVALGLVSLSDRIFNDDRTTADAMIVEGLEIARGLGDEWLVGRLLYERGWLFVGWKDYPAARGAFEASQSRFKSLGDEYWTGVASVQIGNVNFYQGDYARARQEIDSTLHIFRRAKTRYQVMSAVTMLGLITHAEHDYELAKKYYGQAFEMAREFAGKSDKAAATINLGYIAVHDGELNQAKSLFGESLTLGQELGHTSFVAESLVGLASISAATKQSRRAVQLLAVADTLLRAGDPRVVSPTDEAEYTRNLAIARKQMDEADFQTAWNEGRDLTTEQAIEIALADVGRVLPSAAPSQPHDPNALTPRELEVLGLLANGLSDMQIADKLVISRRTVSTHLTSIYAKMGVNSRSAATRCAHERKLV